MIRRWVYVVLFLSSYAPLFLILAIRTWGNPLLVVLFGGIAVLGIASLFGVLRTAGRTTPVPVQVSRATSREADATAYIASYIIPFIPSGTPHASELLALSVLLVVLGGVYVNSALIYVNPMLHLLGYSAYDVADEQSNQLIVLSRRLPLIGATAPLHKISSGVAVWNSPKG